MSAEIIEKVADAIDAARFRHPEYPRERPRPFCDADQTDREYARRLAKAAVAVQSWQPIETIPREPLDKAGYGPSVQLFVDGEVGIGMWDRDFDKPYVEYPQFPRGEPTHWQPLPEPPK